jgi:hypothetical protein
LRPIRRPPKSAARPALIATFNRKLALMRVLKAFCRNLDDVLAWRRNMKRRWQLPFDHS